MPLLRLAVITMLMNAAASAVTLEESDTAFTLANEHVKARIDKRTGRLASLQYREAELLAANGGYWSVAARSSRFGALTSAKRVDDGARVQVACRFAADETSLPCDVEMRYALGDGDAGIYVTSVWEHRAELPPLSMGEARWAMKLNPAIFDYLAVDERRMQALPSGTDWDRGAEMNIKEVRRITTGPFAGRIEHKYDYSAILADTPAYGWASTKRRFGLWLINPSIEYLSGGPTKVELTGHLDVNPGGLPVLLNMWLGSHYGGSIFGVANGEAWSKVIGPFFLYLNADAEPAELWRDAVSRAAKERAAWPYAWTKPSPRGEVRGQLVLNDIPGGELRHAHVGLTAPDYEVRGRKVDWQHDAKFYQYWTRTEEDGRFTLRAPPGNHTLRAFADGVLGEFARAEVIVKTDAPLDLGTLAWKPVRHGRTLWEIGTPDRSAAEFRHGNDYWQWGLYLKYAQEFPDDVTFTIGKSNPRTDWNYAQPPRLNATGRVERASTWRIVFDLPEAPLGKPTLRLGIAGNRSPSGIEVSVNDAPVGGTGPLPDTGVMHRDGIRGAWFERSVSFDAAKLRAGSNVIGLTVPARSWVDGVLYDYLRLEVE